MKQFNPLIELGCVPLIDNSTYNEEMKLIEESEFLCGVVDTGLKLLDEEYDGSNAVESKSKQQNSIESAYMLLTDEKKDYGYKYQIFDTVIIHGIANISGIKKYLIISDYLLELRLIAVYRDINSEGKPKTSQEREILERIKDKHRYIMIDRFKKLTELNQLTLIEILFQTFIYLLNVRCEFEKIIGNNIADEN